MKQTFLKMSLGLLVIFCSFITSAFATQTDHKHKQCACPDHDKATTHDHKHKQCACPNDCKKCSHKDAKKDIISVSEAFVRPTASANMSSAAYLTLKNSGLKADKLIKVESDMVSNIQIHDTKIDKNGVMLMLPIENGLTIPAQQAIVFKPRGLHIMLMGVKEPLNKGQSIPLTFIFEKLGSKTIHVSVGDNFEPSQCKH
jgi:periplasmic copper chaperone A